MDQASKKMLIIEDEAPVLKALADKFTREGFSVLQATDGQVGLSLALKEEPMIILLDIVMPKMDGMTMLKNLRQENEYGKKVPVIFLTNLSADNEKIMKVITEYEPAYYLVKSNWAINDVVEKVKERLTRNG